MKNQAKFKIVNSNTMSQSARFRRKVVSSIFPFLVPTKKAEVPARKTNTGAQKCVTHRVANNKALVFVRSTGS